jgi:hypothetical protein
MLRVLYCKLGMMSYDVIMPQPAAGAAAVIVTTKIGWTWILTMPSATTSTWTAVMGGPHD